MIIMVSCALIVDYFLVLKLLASSASCSSAVFVSLRFIRSFVYCWWLDCIQEVTRDAVDLKAW